MLNHKALSACTQYDHWVREIQRLTKAIGDVECPREMPPVDEEGFPDLDWRQQVSHFREACQERRGDEYALRTAPIPLEDVARLVADCPECSKLARLIAERRTARQKLGAAKRRIRAIAKCAAKEAAHV